MNPESESIDPPAWVGAVRRSGRASCEFGPASPPARAARAHHAGELFLTTPVSGPRVEKGWGGLDKGVRGVYIVTAYMRGRTLSPLN